MGPCWGLIARRVAHHLLNVRHLQVALFLGQGKDLRNYSKPWYNLWTRPIRGKPPVHVEILAASAPYGHPILEGLNSEAAREIAKSMINGLEEAFLQKQADIDRLGL